MAENTKIEWCDATFNPWRGCTKVSEGCRNCYADTQSKRNPSVLGIWGPQGTRVVASEAQWRLPLKWDREAKAAGERRRVFCASMADVFEDWSGPIMGSNGSRLARGNEWHVSGGGFISTDMKVGRDIVTMNDCRIRLFDLIHDTPNLDWLLLTKRPESIVNMLADAIAGHGLQWPWRNVWLGTSVENQQAADERIPHLLRIPAAVRFLSCEPLLGAVDLSPWLDPVTCEACGTVRDVVWKSREAGVCERFCPRCHKADPESSSTISAADRTELHWVICGGEGGPHARPCNVEWIRSIVWQCREAGVACFMKQLGQRPYRQAIGSGNPVEPIFPLTMRDPKGGDMTEWPADLRVREFPKVGE